MRFIRIFTFISRPESGYKNCRAEESFTVKKYKKELEKSFLRPKLYLYHTFDITIWNPNSMSKLNAMENTASFVLVLENGARKRTRRNEFTVITSLPLPKRHHKCFEKQITKYPARTTVLWIFLKNLEQNHSETISENSLVRKDITAKLSSAENSNCCVNKFISNELKTCWRFYVENLTKHETFNEKWITGKRNHNDCITLINKFDVGIRPVSCPFYLSIFFLL